MAIEALYTCDEAATLVRMPARSLRHLVRTGQIRALTLPNGDLRIEQSALEEFIAHCRGR